MAATPVERTQVFLCYSHEDLHLQDPHDVYAKEFSQLLAVYRNRGLLEVWSDEQIQVGTDYRQQVDEAIARTRVALVLLSNAFLASSFIQDFELPRLLEAQAVGDLTIIPLLFRQCTYEKSGLEHFQAALPVSKPLKRLRPGERDRAWVRIGEALEQAWQGAEEPGTRKAHKWRTPALFDGLDAGEPSPQAAEKGTRQAEDDTAYAERYREKICHDPQLTQIQVLDMDHPLELDDIYVRVQLHRENRFRYQAESLEQGAQDPLSILSIQQRHMEERERAGMEPMQAVREHPHCVIVGDPGAGKTTLLKYLTLQCCRGKFAGGADCAFFVSLHAFARKYRAGGDLIAYILEEWQRLYHLPTEQARGFLECRLQAGNMLILLDALDETMIGDENTEAEQTYRAIHDAVSDLHRAYPRAPMVVTARKAAYHQHAHLVGFDLLEVVDFLPEQVEAFVKNWFQHDPIEERRGMAEGLLTRLRNNPRISDLAANPLLLGLIAYTYEENNERLPEKRAELYKLCVETLLRKWDDKRKIRRVHPAIDTYEQESLLPRLAWHFHVQGLRYFSQSELLAQIKEFAEIQGKSTREERLQEILVEITSDNGFLREQAHGSYGFLHLTLQEYFAARHLAHMHHGLELLLEHLGHPWWEEVTLLYAGQEDDASELLTSLLSPGGDGAAPEDFFSSKLLLAGRCLATQVQIIRARHLRKTIPNLLIEKLHSPFSLLVQQAAEVLAELGRAYPEHEIHQTLLKIIVDKNVEFQVRTELLHGFDTLRATHLQQMLLPLLWEPGLTWDIYDGIIFHLSRLKTREMRHELQHTITDQQAEEFIKTNAVHLLCRIADTPTLQWLLELAGTEPDNPIYMYIPSQLDYRRGELPQATLSYISRVLDTPQAPALVKLQCLTHMQRSVLPNSRYMNVLLKIILDKRANYLLRSAALDMLPTDAQIDTLLRSMLTTSSISPPIHARILAYLMRDLEAGQVDELCTILQDSAMPTEVRQQAIIELRRSEDRALVPILQRIGSTTELNQNLRIEALLSLIDCGERQVLQALLPLLGNSRKYRAMLKATSTHFMDLSTVYLEMRYAYLRVPPDWNTASVLARNLDWQSLVELCNARRIDYQLRVNLAYEIARLSDDRFVPPFIALVRDRTVIQEVRLAFIHAIGELARDVAQVEALLTLYQGAPVWAVKDALYTALYKVARRANVTVIPGGPEGSVLQVVKR